MDIGELAEFLRVTLETVGTHLDELPSFELGGKAPLPALQAWRKWIRNAEHRVQPAERLI